MSKGIKIEMTANSDPAVDAIDNILIKMLPKDYFEDAGDKIIFNSVTRNYNRNAIGKAGLKSPVTFDTFKKWHADCMKRFCATGDFDLFLEFNCSIREYIQFKILEKKN